MLTHVTVVINRSKQMKKIYSLIVLVVALLATGCSGNMLAEMNRSREADTA